MANEVKIKVTSEADIKGLKDANTELDKTKISAYVAGESIDELGDNFTESDHKATEAKRSFTSLNESLAKLDAAAEMSRAELKRLSAALADTDDAAQRIDLGKAIRKLQADLNSTTRAKKTLIVDVDFDEKKTASRFEKLGEDVAGLASNHVGATIGAAVGIAAAPVIIGTISTALAAGVGAAGLGAGIGLAIKNDPALSAEAKEVGAKFMQSMGEGAQTAFSGPLKQSLSILDDAAEHAAQSWSKAFTALAPTIVPLTRDIADAVTEISDTLASVASSSGPALQGVGDSIRLLADGLSDFITILADGGPEAASNLTLIAGAIADNLRADATLLDMLNKLSNNPILTGPLIPLLRDHYMDAANATGTFAKHQSELQDAMDGVVSLIEFERTGLKNLAADMKAETDPVFGLLNAQDHLAEAQKNVAETTKEHGKKSRETEAALRDLAEAAIDVEDKAGDLAATTGGKLTPALRATLEAAGLTKGEINNLEGQFKAAHRAGDNFAKTYRAKIDASTATAESRIKHVQNLLRQVRSKRISVDVLVADSQLDKVYNTLNRLGGGNYAHGGIKGAASGMGAGGLAWVGERGPELVSLPTGSTVHSSGDSMRMMRQGMNAAGGGGEFVLRAAPSANRELIDVLMASMQYEVRTRYSGSIARALGQESYT